MRTPLLAILIAACATAVPPAQRAKPYTMAIDPESGCRVVDEETTWAVGPVPNEAALCLHARRVVMAALRSAGYVLVDAKGSQMDARLNATLNPKESRVFLGIQLSASGRFLDDIAKNVEVKSSLDAALEAAARLLISGMQESSRLQKAGLGPG